MAAKGHHRKTPLPSATQRIPHRRTHGAQPRLSRFCLGSIYGYQSRETLIQDTLVYMGLWTKALSLTEAGTIRIATKVVDVNFKKLNNCI